MSISRVFLIAVAIIFFSTTNTYADKVVVSRTVSGGKLIKQGENEGKLGYKYSRRTETSTGKVTIYCEGKGDNLCPENAVIPKDEDDEITRIVYEAIDMGLTNGEFIVGAFACRWENGEKETEEGNDGEIIPIYSYHLEIEWAEWDGIVEDMTIYVYPNPVQGQLTIRFSMPIEDMVGMRITDMEGNLKWQLDVRVSGDTYTLSESVIHSLGLGMYLLACTIGDNMIPVTFVKQ